MLVTFLLNLALSSIAILLSTYIIPGIHLTTWTTALLVALVLGALNSLVKPVLLVLTLPITILTLGLFMLVLNAIMIELTAMILPGFRVDNFGWAIIFGIVLAIAQAVLHRLIKI